MSEELTKADLDAQGAADLPDKEAMSLLDPVLDQSLLNLNVDLALDADVAAPVDAAVAANANVAAPIDAAVAANVASVGSTAVASADQDSIIVQNLEGVATATADQDVTMDQGN
ncbi:MAG TPA: hypothetical protein VNA57_02190 [Acidimicrobiales bacterium]|nr:hypothetical protein [Acidimicrobiales bacterium]